MAAPPLFSGDVPISKPEQGRLTGSGKLNDNQQPGHEEEQAGGDDGGPSAPGPS